MHSSCSDGASPFEDGDVDVEGRDLAARYAVLLKAEAAVQAQIAEVLAEASALGEARVAALRSGASRDAELPVRALAAELGAAARVADRTVQRRMSDASLLARNFPATLAAWGTGSVTAGHVWTIVEHGTPITDPDARAAFEVEALARAGTTTPGRLKAALVLLAEDLQPRSLAERHQKARAERGVRVRDLGDGMAEICTVQPAVLAHAIQDRLTQQARALKDADPGDVRTIDQIRADLVADMLLTAAPDADTGEGLADGFGGLGSIRAVVNVTVPALALAGVTADPGELVGRAPVDLATARELAGQAPGWDRVLSDPITGGVLAVDRYTPTADMKRFLRARDQHCRFPGCRQPVHRCDLDHSIDFALGGETTAGNLAHLCRRHHTLKGETPWKVKQLGGGVLEWTSPGGVAYIDNPPSMMRFTPPDDDDTPF